MIILQRVLSNIYLRVEGDQENSTNKDSRNMRQHHGSDSLSCLTPHYIHVDFHSRQQTKRGCRFQGLGFGFWGKGLRFWDLGCKFRGLRIWVLEDGFWFWGLGSGLTNHKPNEYRSEVRLLTDW